MATSRCEFRLSLIVTLQYLVHTAAAAAGVVHLDPLPDTCVCIINAIDDVVASTRACEKGNIWLSSNECYIYTGANKSCRSNDILEEKKVFFRLRRKFNDSVWVASKHVHLQPQLSRCIATDAPTDKICPNIVTRAQWGARPPRDIVNLTEPVPRIFIHHTATPSCTTQQACSRAVRGIQNFHMDTRGWDDIGYNYLVGEDGNAYEGRGWDHKGAQVRACNSVSLGFSVIGNYNTRLPNISALSVVKQLIACALHEDKAASNYTLHGHRDGDCTECPGQKFYELVRTWPHYGGQLPRNCSKAAGLSQSQTPP